MKNKVSIVVPIYNIKTEYLRKSLDTLINQTLKEIEIILVNDGSTKENREVCEEYKNKDNRIILINQANKGVALARDVGIERVTGEWISFVDPDDWIELDMMETLYSHAKDQDIIVESVYINYKNKQYENNFFYKSGIIDTKGKEEMLIDIISRPKEREYSRHICVGGPWAKLYNTNFINKNNLRFRKGKFAEDDVFNLYAFQNAKKIEIFNDESKYHYRKSDSSICNKYDKDVIKYTNLMVEEQTKFIDIYYKNNKEFEEVLRRRKISAIELMAQRNFFHKDNKLKRREIYKQISEVIKKPVYQDAIKQIEIKNLSKFLKIFTIALRLNNKLLMEALLKVKKVLKQKGEMYE